MLTDQEKGVDTKADTDPWPFQYQDSSLIPAGFLGKHDRQVVPSVFVCKFNEASFYVQKWMKLYILNPA